MYRDVLGQTVISVCDVCVSGVLSSESEDETPLRTHKVNPVFSPEVRFLSGLSYGISCFHTGIFMENFGYHIKKNLDRNANIHVKS